MMVEDVVVLDGEDIGIECGNPLPTFGGHLQETEPVSNIGTDNVSEELGVALPISCLASPTHVLQPPEIFTRC